MGIQQLQKTIEAKERLLNEKDKQIQEKQHVIAVRDQTLEKSQRELQKTLEQLQMSQQLVSELQEILQEKDKTISDLQQTISTQERKIQQLGQENPASRDFPKQQPITAPQGAPQKDISKMRWMGGKNAPVGMTRGAAVMQGNTAYFRPAFSHTLYSYNKEEQWSQLPDNPFSKYGLAVIDDLLTSVGGVNNDQLTSILLSLTVESGTKIWVKAFPSMPTPRSTAACVTTGSTLIVVGGQGVDCCLDRVEVMSTENKQWTTVSSLPQPLALLSGAVCGDTLFLAGGFKHGPRTSKSVFTCSLADLFTPTLSKQTLSPSHNVWKEICSTPVGQSTLVSFGGSILAIGGRDESDKSTSKVNRH